MVEKIVLFLFGAIADFFAFMLMARFLMQACRTSFANPVGEAVVGLTNWAVKPLRRIVPGVLGFDLASLLPAWLLQAALILVAFLLRGGDGMLGAVGGLLPAALAGGAVDTLRIGVYVLIAALIGAAILSWVNPSSPLAPAVSQLTRPMLRPIQRIVRPISGIDLSPLVAILLLQVLLMLLDGLKGGVLRAFLA
jgi:YggT family protein